MFVINLCGVGEEVSLFVCSHKTEVCVFFVNTQYYMVSEVKTEEKN